MQCETGFLGESAVKLAITSTCLSKRIIIRFSNFVSAASVLETKERQTGLKVMTELVLEEVKSRKTVAPDSKHTSRKITGVEMLRTVERRSPLRQSGRCCCAITDTQEVSGVLPEGLVWRYCYLQC